MFNWHDILILGDSFCACRGENFFWPNLIYHKFSGKYGIPRGHGFGGTSWWSTRKQLLMEMSSAMPKILIICHTEPQRIPSDFDIPFNMASVDSGQLLKKNREFSDKYPMEDFVKSAQLYYKFLHSTEFNIWSLHQWFNELSIITAKIPFVIHLPCFQESMYPHAHGISCSTPLFSWVKEPLKPTNPVHGNHMSIEENANFADHLYQAISNYMNNPNCDRQFTI
jgi:hypothetical protein